MRRLGQFALLLAALCLAACLSSEPARSGTWADVDAHLTVSEFIEWKLREYSRTSGTDPDNLIDIVPGFLPSSGPDRAMVVLEAIWNPKSLSVDELRSRVERVSKNATQRVIDVVRFSGISKRWPIQETQDHILIRHTSLVEWEKTIAVTYRGTTSFDRDAILEARKKVEALGGEWREAEDKGRR